MKVFWDLKFHADNENDAREGLSDFEKSTGLSVGNPNLVKYWKMPEYFEIRFETDGFSDTPEQAIEELQLICDKIGNQWDSNSPMIYRDGQVEWHSTIDSKSSSIFVERLAWAHCQFIPMK